MNDYIGCYLTNTYQLNKKSYQNRYKSYGKYRSAGIIPYAYVDGKIMFLLQKYTSPRKKNDFGWNDFGGKMDEGDSSLVNTAAREFNEETNCIFYINEQSVLQNEELNLNDQNNYESYANILRDILPKSVEYYSNKIKSSNIPYVYSKNIYISFFVNVIYIPANKISIHEDIHLNYTDKYIRECKWFSLDEIINLDPLNLHRRLRITHLSKNIKSFYFDNIFESNKT